LVTRRDLHFYHTQRKGRTNHLSFFLARQIFFCSLAQASAHYTPEATTWVKIKNHGYSQAAGRADFFDRRRAR
jgi:hypothetical protein